MKMTSDGRVTVPQHIRDRLGLTAGTEVEWEMGDGYALLRTRADAAAGRGRALVAHLRGRATVKMSTDEIMALTRGDV